MKTCAVSAILCAVSTFPVATWADTFGSASDVFEIHFVTIGNPGNPADTIGRPSRSGAVPYRYRIGRFEVSEEMIDVANRQSANDGTPLGITKDARGANKPATSISWLEAAEFANWLNTSTGHTPAYKFDDVGDFQLWAPGDAGYDPNNQYRNRLAKYFLPSADEWYKAAFYDPSSGMYFRFPTGSNDVPMPIVSGTAPHTAVFDGLATGPADTMLAGGLSPYGTMAQAGNVFEWMETEADLVNDSVDAERILRGGGWPSSRIGLGSNTISTAIPEQTILNGGFRVASIVPEPDTILLSALVFVGLLMRRVSGTAGKPQPSPFEFLR